MQTHLSPDFEHLPLAQEAKDIIGKCVHCGFCTATCPTYQWFGDELDGPRGRIYQIKQVIEGGPISASTQMHLDRCLTCRNCESTCPSGVHYGRLIDIGRELVDERLPANSRGNVYRLTRWALRESMTRPKLFAALLQAGQMVRPILPAVLRDKMPRAQASKPTALPVLGVPAVMRERVIMLKGCVQPALSPNINTATQRVLTRMGVEVQFAEQASCCGAIRAHNGDAHGALDEMRRNIDAWTALLDAGAQAIVMNASGCGVTVKDYPEYLKHDAVYLPRAQRISAACVDIAEYLHAHLDWIQPYLTQARSSHTEAARVTYHPSCTLQHGQKVRGVVEQLLSQMGVNVRLCADAHLCCGAAGTYAVLQPMISKGLKEQKIERLLATEPEVILSANIGCISHLQSGTDVRVMHWVEWVDEVLSEQK